MNRALCLCICTALILPLLTTSNATAQIPDVPGWDLVWNDEFDGTSLNTTNWTALNRRNSFNDEKQYYHPNQVAVSGGNLQLTAIDTPRQGKAYQSGLVTSNDLFGPGRFEARIDLPTTQGMWPAFWLNANHIPWPQGGEIDIMENRGSQPNVVSSAYHWQTNPGPCCDEHQFVFDEYAATEGGELVDFHAGFHTYTAEWDETTIRYYVDGNLHYTVTEAADRPIFETPKNIILNLAVGGFFGGDPNGSTVFPQTMFVDYVRYWQPDQSPPGPGENLLSNPGFDNLGGSLSGWSTFGNTINNVTANNQLAEEGTHALKVYGQFNGPNNLSGVTQGTAISGGEILRAEVSSQTPSWDTLFGKSNEVTMKIEFYSQFGAAANSGAFLGETSQLIHDGSTAQNIWHDHTLQAIAPANAVEARLSFVFNQPGSDNGAIWIDSVGLFIDTSLPGDANGDGMVDLLDLDILGANFSQATQNGSTDGDFNGDGVVDLLDLDVLGANFGESLSAEAVPEPTTPVLITLALLGIACSRRVAPATSR